MPKVTVIALLLITLCAGVNANEDDLILMIPAIVGANTEEPASSEQFAINSGVVKFGIDDSEAEVMQSGAARIVIGQQRLYIGTRQVSPINQDPIIRSFGGGRTWTRTDFEATGADGRGVSLFWSGSDLYASFTVDGTQGQPSDDFRRVSQGAQQSWLRSYGKGGGSKVSVVAKIDAQSGELLAAVYISAVLSSGNSNTLTVNNITGNSQGNLVVEADSFFSPRQVDGDPLPRTTSNGSPFDYQIELAPDLLSAISASSSDF